MPDTAATATAYEALIQFLYRAPIGLVQTSLAGDIAMINPMAAQLLMPLVPDGNLFNLFDVLAPLAPQLRELARQPVEAGGTICDALHLTMPASAAPAFDTAPRTLALQLLRLDDTTLMGTLSDATAAVQREQQRLAARVHAATRTDGLTALPNRLALLEAVDAALERRTHDPGARWAVLLVDADRFERINVTLGPAMGDAVLRIMAERIRAVAGERSTPTSPPTPGGAETVKAPGGIVARFGSDEFAVLLRLDSDAARDDTGDGDHDREGASRIADLVACEALARRLVEALGAPCAVGGTDVHASASVGVVRIDDSHAHAVAVMQDADLALREAKREGGARHGVFTPVLRDRAWQRGSLEADLRRALDDGTQLFVVYQPIVALADGAIAGMEALVRWRHPLHGVVPPDRFIGIAEETGLIVALGEWVLRQACDRLADWRRALGPLAPRSMSVNLSRAQVLEPSIVGTVARALAASGLPADALQLEVTESLAAQDAIVGQRLGDLKALGLSLALDDFGTGYSSLASLHLLPVDVVKIDRSFVGQSVTSAHHRVLIEAVVKVARSLGMTTVAEGVETAAQDALLAVLDCDKVQGYFHARPMAADDASAWLRARSRAPAKAGRPMAAREEDAPGRTAMPTGRDPHRTGS
ncbi:putative bifunctional diguanylate cyclase/phosphodiesterase [Variovorax sp. PvP013]|uniref:putative bifunctional diguanylate cyclase/phosphodiesterase n=1 Tax=Variovorax sp. PvP013 TaxID=3156435 RepID=UPI003D1BE274